MDSFEQLLSPKNGCILITLQMVFGGCIFGKDLVCFEASCSKDQKFQWRKPFGILSWEFDGYPQIPITLSIMVSQKWWFGDPKEPCEKQSQPPRFWRFRWYRSHVYFWWRGVSTPRKKSWQFRAMNATWHNMISSTRNGLWNLPTFINIELGELSRNHTLSLKLTAQAPENGWGWELGDYSGRKFQV